MRINHIHSLDDHSLCFIAKLINALLPLVDKFMGIQENILSELDAVKTDAAAQTALINNLATKLGNVEVLVEGLFDQVTAGVDEATVLAKIAEIRTEIATGAAAVAAADVVADAIATDN